MVSNIKFYVLLCLGGESGISAWKQICVEGTVRRRETSVLKSFFYQSVAEVCGSHRPTGFNIETLNAGIFEAQWEWLLGCIESYCMVY